MAKFRLAIQLEYDADSQNYGTDDVEEMLEIDKRNWSDPYTLYELLEFHWKNVEWDLKEIK